MATAYEFTNGRPAYPVDYTADSRMPTSVIPTVSGTLWQSIDPHGRNYDGESIQMIHDLSTSTNSLRRSTKGLRCSSTKIYRRSPLGSQHSASTQHNVSTNDESLAGRLDSMVECHETSRQSLNDRLSPTSIAHILGMNKGYETRSVTNSEPTANNISTICNHLPISKATKQIVNTEIIVESAVPVDLTGLLNTSPSISDPGSGGTANSRIRRMAKRINHNKKCRLTLWLTAFGCAFSVFFFLLAYDSVVEFVASQQLALRDSGTKYDAWTKTSIPVYYTVVILNLTNPVEFMEGSRPRVHEIGPYTYRMEEVKTNITFHGNGTVTYRTKPTYFFEPSRSGGSEDDRLWTVNIPYINTADAVKHNPFLQMIINYATSIHSFDTLRHLTVRQLLWGHQSKVLDWGRQFQELPYPHPHFGLLVGLNNTAQESYTMFTGVNNPSKMNAIYAWNGRTKLNFWNGDSCNKIYGTDAGGFSPGVSRTDTLHIFNAQLCRSIPLIYQKSIKHGGINAYRFVPPSNVFSYGASNPENSCFCPDGVCPPAGVLDMKPCYWGAAIAFSFPHFYQADPSLRHMVKGLSPDPKKHGTEFDIFPDLGIPLRVKLRMQMNVVLDRNQALNRGRHYDLIYPIFWFEAGIDSLPSNLVEKLQMAQDLPPLLKNVFIILCGFLSVLFLIILMAHSVMVWCSNGLSSLRSRSNRGSNTSSLQDTRSTTPDLSEDRDDGSTLNDANSNAMKRPVSGSYKSFNSPQLGLDDIVCTGDLVDHHTLLPPYKSMRRSTLPSRTSVIDIDQNQKAENSHIPNEVVRGNRRLAGTNSDAVDYARHEPDASNNEYPPEYVGTTAAILVGSDTIKSNKSSVSSVVSAEIHHYEPVGHNAADPNPNRLGEEVDNEYSNLPYPSAQNPSTEQNSSQSSSEERIDQVTPKHPLYSRPSATYNVPVDSYYQMEHKSLVPPTSPKIVEEKLKQRAAPLTLDVAPLARPEDVILPVTPSSEMYVPIIPLEGSPKSYRSSKPLATSSPQISSDYITLPKLRNTKPTPSNGVRKQTLNNRTSPNLHRPNDQRNSSSPDSISSSQHRKISETSSHPSTSSTADIEQHPTPVTSRTTRRHTLPSPDRRNLASSSNHRSFPEQSPPPLESDL